MGTPACRGYKIKTTDSFELGTILCSVAVSGDIKRTLVLSVQSPKPADVLELDFDEHDFTMEADKCSPVGDLRTANMATSIFQVVLCILSYAALVVLFLTQGMHIRSLTHVGEGSIPPAAVISVLAIILVGSTSVLVTRAVEHGLWATILRRNLDTEDDNPLTDDEVRRRAQWSVSPLARLIYIFRGRSWSMKLSGILLLGTAALNPVLLYSVSPKQFSTSTTIEVGPSDLPFSGFTSASNAMYGADGMYTVR
jgi:hypothetical protein